MNRLSLSQPASRPRSRDRGGFTLIELLAASAASAILLLAVYGIFHRAVKTRDNAVERTRETALRMHAAGMIRNDLRNAWISGTDAIFASVLAGGRDNGGSRFPGYLRFTTTTGRDTPDDTHGDVQQVEYSISDDTTSGANNEPADSPRHDTGTLVRDVTRNLLDTQAEPDRQELLAGVQSIEVTFYDGQDWRDTWQLSGSNDATVPSAVRLRIQQAAPSDRLPVPPPLEILVPWTVEPLTSATATATGT